MSQRMIVVVAGGAILFVGVIAAMALRQTAPAAKPPAPISATDTAAAEAQADAITRDLHRDDQKRYKPQPAKAIGELPRASSDDH